MEILLLLVKFQQFPQEFFSSKHKDLKAISKGAKIAIPSDASNTARAISCLKRQVG